MKAVGGEERDGPPKDPYELDFSALGKSVTTIQREEERGITKAQLSQLCRFLKTHANRSGLLSGWKDLTTNQTMNVDFINQYQLNDWVIKPSTRFARFRGDPDAVTCSFVELLTDSDSIDQQMPDWFCSQ